jgi:hypothetical protein
VHNARYPVTLVPPLSNTVLNRTWIARLIAVACT